MLIQNEDRGPRLTLLSEKATADMQMSCHIFPILSTSERTIIWVGQERVFVAFVVTRCYVVFTLTTKMAASAAGGRFVASSEEDLHKILDKKDTVNTKNDIKRSVKCLRVIWVLLFSSYFSIYNVWIESAESIKCFFLLLFFFSRICKEFGILKQLLSLYEDNIWNYLS